MPMPPTENATAPLAEKEEVNKTGMSAEASTLPTETPKAELDTNNSAAEADTPTQIPTKPATSQSTDGLYHTDVYPDNVYSEEIIYDTDGNRIGKTTTIPTEFGPDTIWIDDHAYYDLPGFGLIEWSGPSSVTEDYTMYENGNKVGIMGGEGEAQMQRSSVVQPEGQDNPTGEVIDQSLTEVPEKNCILPNYKPDTTPPDDPNARLIP